MMSEFAGQLSQRIEIWTRADARTEIGQVSGEWEKVGTCLAKIEPEGVGAEIEGMTISSLPRFRITVRHRQDLQVDQRIVWKGRPLMIRQVIQSPIKPDRVTVRCEEVR